MKFVSVRTSTIRPKSKLLFDVYVHFREQHLKYKSANDSFDPETLGRFKIKKVKKLFIPSEQEPSYLAYLDQALDGLRETNVEVGARAEMAQDTLKQEAENIGKSLENATAYESSKNRINKVVDFMLAEPKALAEMLGAAGLSVDDSAHGSAVSSLCLALGAHSGTLEREDLIDLAVAGLLHDAALKDLGFDVRTRLEDIPKESRPLFRSHPQKAVDMVAGKQFITPRVLRLIENHEEYGDGLGFPNKKNLARLEPDSQVFNLCDAFDHFSIQKGLPAKECFDAFVEERGDHFSLKLLEVLEKQVKG